MSHAQQIFNQMRSSSVKKIQGDNFTFRLCRVGWFASRAQKYLSKLRNRSLKNYKEVILLSSYVAVSGLRLMRRNFADSCAVDLSSLGELRN